VTHKTFHRYTVRAKRGTAQGLQDAQGRASRSAGANLRRYNEATLYKVSYLSDLVVLESLFFFASQLDSLSVIAGVLGPVSFQFSLFLGGQRIRIPKSLNPLILSPSVLLCISHSLHTIFFVWVSF
jgi:hypothetical protein